jgi:hypothetical protein
MAKNIDPKLKKIGDYLKLDESSIFSIPEYQRAYSWEVKHCDKLWQDIEAFIESGGTDPYFFGTVIINCQDNDTTLSLIDGQQRTTTFLLLLKALLLRLNNAIADNVSDEESAALIAGLKARRDKILSILYRVEAEDIPEMLKNFGKFKDRPILDNKSNNEIFKTELATILKAADYAEAEFRVIKIPRKQKENKYTNYFRNFKFFYDRLLEISEIEVNKFARNILERCEIIEIRSWNVEQAIAMFNSLNSAGLPLSDADIISALLYSEAVKHGKDKEFSNNWKTLLDNADKLKSYGIADIDAILMQYMYINRARRKEYIADSGSINVTTPGLRRYYTETDNGKKLLAEPITLCEELIKLTEIWLNIKDYALVKLLLKFNENVKLYLAGYLSRYAAGEITEDTVNRIGECLLRLFAILELVDIGYSSSRFKTFLFGENIKLVDNNVAIEGIEQDFRDHISRLWAIEDIKKEVSEYEKNILVFLNEYLFAKSKGLSFTFTEKYDIEHIMPSSGKNLLHIRGDAGIADESEFAFLVNKLGNKILLEEDINRAIGNEWFRMKIETSVTDRNGYKDSQYAIATALVEKYKESAKPYWQKDDIIATTEKIAERIAKYVFGAEAMSL